MADPIQSKNNLILKMLSLMFAGTVLICLLKPSLADARSVTLPKTHLYSQQLIYFPDNEKLSFNVNVHDPVGVTEVRLYFRFDSSQPFVYREMTDVGEGGFTTKFPAVKPTVKAIEYVFLVVNQQKQVIISQTYTMTKKNDRRPDSTSAQGVRPEQYLLKTEVVGTEKVKTYFQQSEKISISQISSQFHYGILAGLFSPKQIGTEVVSGYFGAFRYDSRKGMVPVEGHIVVGQSSSMSITEENNLVTSGISTEETSGPAISGHNWAGVFWRSDNYEGTAVSLTAKITQNSNGMVTITTTLVGIGHFFQGNIYPNYHMLLYDAYDNEDWTTHYGPATDSYIKIADFIRPPTSEDLSPPLNIIELKRISLVPILLLLK